jgi:proteasome lid subunit RPN8/RPN11
MMQYELQISRNDLIRLQDHADMMAPDEAVALLFGTISGISVYVARVELMENTSVAAHTSFSVSPEVEYSLLLEAEKRGESLIGIFHSHPAPPRPSQSDLRNMHLNPVVWLVASKLSGSWIVKGYTLEENGAVEVVMHVLESRDPIP